MDLTDWVFSHFSSDQVIDLYFILSDLFDMEISPEEWNVLSPHDQMAMAQTTGISFDGNHAYDPQGNDLGLIGKLVL